MKIGPDKPVVGATLVVARPRHQPVLIPICGLHKAMVIPNAAQPHPVIPLKILSATLFRHSGGEPAPYPDTGQESSLLIPPSVA